jgi:hypothetical protein
MLGSRLPRQSRTKWLAAIVEDEAPKVRELIPRGAVRYVLMTNVPGTAHLDKGSIDKLNRRLRLAAMRAAWQAAAGGQSGIPEIAAVNGAEASLRTPPRVFPPFRAAHPPGDTPTHGLAAIVLGAFPRTAGRQRCVLLRQHTHQTIGGSVRPPPVLTILDILIHQHSIVLQHLKQFVIEVPAPERPDPGGVDMKSFDQDQPSEFQ